MRIDPTKTWRMVEARLAREHSPRLRRNLETVLAHMKAEAAPDLDALMATIADDARYHAWGAADPLYSPQGKEAVRRFYTAFVSSGAHRLEFDVDRLVVDEHCVVTEGAMRIAYPGAIVALLGRTPTPSATASRASPRGSSRPRMSGSHDDDRRHVPGRARPGRAGRPRRTRPDLRAAGRTARAAPLRARRTPRREGLPRRGA